MENINNPIRYSYSRLAQYKNCPYAYNQKYNLKKYYDTLGIEAGIGTLIHYIEEQISKALMQGNSPNYTQLIQDIKQLNVPKKSILDREGDIFGTQILSAKFPTEFYEPSKKTGLSFFSKISHYIDNITKQEDFMRQNPHLEIVAVELPFEYNYNGYIIHGFIDKLLKYKGEDKYQIYDIKTRDRLFSKQDATTPLQHVIYGLAVQDKFKLAEPPTEYFYDLPFIQEIQQVGTKGFIKRGIKQLDKIFAGIKEGEYPPKPSPLCHWCSYSNTNPKVSELGKHQCPYYSKWLPSSPSYEVKNLWIGPEETAVLIENLKLDPLAQGIRKKFEF